MTRLTDLPIPLVSADEHLSTAFIVLLLVHILAGVIEDPVNTDTHSGQSDLIICSAP